MDFINSVQFSNHTGYGQWTGQVLQDEDLHELMRGLKMNNLHQNYTHILTGYARSASFLEAIFTIIREIKVASPETMYLCDPVLGDNGRLYVPEELVSVYRDKLIRVADIVCPNQFEAELLTGVTISDQQSALHVSPPRDLSKSFESSMFSPINLGHQRTPFHGHTDRGHIEHQQHSGPARSTRVLRQFRGEAGRDKSCQASRPEGLLPGAAQEAAVQDCRSSSGC